MLDLPYNEVDGHGSYRVLEVLNVSLCNGQFGLCICQLALGLLNALVEDVVVRTRIHVVGRAPFSMHAAVGLAAHVATASAEALLSWVLAILALHCSKGNLDY